MEPIAIIGIGCRFPGAKDPESFWQLLHNGVDAITEVPKERWDIDAFYDPEPGTPGKMSTRWGGFLEQVDQFEPSFFGISPREVERMDPQQRLVLEVAWEAIENAAIVPSKLSGSQTGVFMAIGNYDYCRLLAKDITLVNAYDGTGNTLSIAANRLSYILNLRGPSVVTETACSSSLVALHFACRSLQSGESNLCLVGGVSLMLSPEPFITYSHARMMAADGRCKTFDASADGYVRGEGCGVVVLKRLSDAIRDEDNIRAVIRGTAVNQDGLSNGLTAPNGPSQQLVIRQALENAGVTPAQISYVEAHGTGTSLGDPIEVKSLKAVLMQGREPDQPCWIGSAKTNIGHLEAASGMAGLIKVALSLQHKEIPPHLHLKQLNPLISLEGTTFSIPTECQPWSAGTERRLAGISAFGFGGTNCHAILEEAPSDFRLPILDFGLGSTRESNESSETNEQPSNPKSKERPLHLLSLSAKSEKALGELAQRYEDFLATHPEASLADVCFTANTARSHFDHRLAVVAESTAQLQETLLAFATGKEATGLVSGQVQSKKRQKIAFLFTGQGSQYVGMGRQLYETQPIFRQALDRCDEILRPYLEQPLLEVLYPDTHSSNPKSKVQNPKLDETAYTQPALFALEYALFQLWKSWGIEPAVVMGHSVGEYVAACVAGVFSLEDGLKLIAARARLMQALPQDGEMVAVFASESQVQTVIQPYAQELSIAAINGPQSTVISGKREAVQDAIATLQAEGVKAKKLTVSHAFHSPLMEPMLVAFEQVASDISYSLPNIKLISNVTGELATAEIATPEYWCRHVRQPVRFAAGMETLHQQGYEVFLEIGAKPILLGMGRYCLPEGVGVWLPSLYQGREDWQQLLQSLGALYVRGVAVDWPSFDQDYPRRRLQLPTYPFQRQRYWVDIPENGHSKAGDLSHEKAQSPILNLLSQGDTQQLVQHLETAGELSEDELKLLPRLLELLVKQNQQQLTTASIKDWLYEVEWQIKSRNQEESGFHEPGTWLILADIGGVGQGLAKVLHERGHSCILVYAGDAYQTKEAGTWSINPSSRADCDRLFQEALLTLDRPLKGVIHLWSLETKLASELTIPSLEQAQALGVGSVLHLLQALVKDNKSTSPRLWLVTRGAVPVGRSLPAVAQAPLWGLGKVVALEHPELWGGMLDLAPEATEDEATKLLAEIGDSQGEDHLAFRDGQRYVARVIRKQLPESQKLTFQSDATYLITGGLGALGLKVARWMVEQGARHLVLTGRRGASSDAQETISQLKQAGAKVLVAQADVCDEGDVVRMLEGIEVSMPPLRGIVHAAGVLDDGILLQQDWERFTRVMAPKVKGAWNLHISTQKLPLDFFVVFSSAASLLGSPGQGNYAAANAFMDALAHYRRSLGLPGLSINWGPWGDTGMAASLNSRNKARLTAQGLTTIAPEQGLQILERVLGQTLAQVGVLPFELSVFKQQLSSGRQLSLLSELVREESPQEESEQVSAQRNELLQRLKEAPATERQQLLMAYLQGKVAKVLGLPSSDLDIQQSLQDLGFDSLMAVDLTSMIRTELQVDVPIRAFIEDPSIANLAALLIEQLIPGNSQPDVVENVLDLNAEAVLDPEISPDNAHIEAVAEPASILLTGATGFLGAFLLQELLDQTQADIYCLVRSPDLESGKARLQDNLKTYDLWNEDYSSRIVPILGDLAQPLLGLSTEQFERMASEIDTIYHNGAFLNYVYPYSKFKPINVLGTQEVLRLACQTKVKPVHHISSVAVFESSAYYGKPVTEFDDIDRSEGIFLGYSQSKWVSERLVKIAGDRGLPITIHRPPLVAGHSQTGLWNTSGFLCRMIQGCIHLGSIMTDLDLMLDLSPVDYNSRAIVYLSRQKESLGKVFHLQNPQLLHWSDLVDFICSMGYPMERVSYKEWQVRLSTARENPLYPLLPFFSQKWSDEQLTYIELNEQGRRPLISCEETLAALSATSIICPPLDSKLLNTYFSYFIRSGFVEPPKVAIGHR
ncbi:MAG TPA: thioester reductase domain-containing protein [Coleofasciculaceae cyanobacterium]